MQTLKVGDYVIYKTLFSKRIVIINEVFEEQKLAFIDRQLWHSPDFKLAYCKLVSLDKLTLLN